MSTSFRIEKLEDRILLAGNITAIQNGSQLVINGDADDNEIYVTNNGGAGTIEVGGLDGETVNGGAGSEIFSGITHIVVRGRAGDDFVLVDEINIAGNLTVQLNQDAGVEQAAAVYDSYIGGNLAVSSDGNADAEIDVQGNYIGGAAQIVTRGGEDDIEVEDSSIGGQLVINAGHGDNDVFLGGSEGLYVGSNLVVIDGADDLLLDAHDVYVGGTLNINAGARGDSEICLEDMYVGGQGWIRTGDGEDLVGICNVEVELGVVVALREGDDVLSVGDSTFHSHVQVSGGPDYDTLIDNGGNSFDVEPIISRFEAFGFGEGCGCIIAQEPL
jgi:hypothetical protein